MAFRVYGRFANVLLANFWSRFGSVPQLLAPGQWLKERGIYMRDARFCMIDESTKHIPAQRLFRFLAERHETLANGTSAKRLVGETTGHQITSRN